MIYLLNSPVLSNHGRYLFSGPISPDQAHRMLANGFVSAIGHESTALLLGRLLRVEVPVNRIRISMEPGDKAIVFRLLARVPTTEIATVEGLDEIPHELALLEREE